MMPFLSGDQQCRSTDADGSACIVQAAAVTESLTRASAVAVALQRDLPHLPSVRTTPRPWPGRSSPSTVAKAVLMVNETDSIVRGCCCSCVGYNYDSN